MFEFDSNSNFDLNSKIRFEFDSNSILNLEASFFLIPGLFGAPGRGRVVWRPFESDIDSKSSVFLAATAVEVVEVPV